MQKYTLVEIFATFIAILGVYLTVRADISLGGESLRGDLLELAAGVTWAISIIGSSKALATKQRSLDRLSFLCQVFIASAVLLMPALYWSPFPARAVIGQDIVLLIVLGIFPTAIAYYLWYEAAAQASAVSLALFFTLTIIFTYLNHRSFWAKKLRYP